MKIKICSVIVNDQEKALKFYTEILGFIKKIDVPAGGHRWLTVVSPDGPDDVEVLLEPNANPDGKAFQEALYRRGTPMTLFSVDDVRAETFRLKALGVNFSQEPIEMGNVMIATFDDTCGNYISIVQPIK